MRVASWRVMRARMRPVSRVSRPARKAKAPARGRCGRVRSGSSSRLCSQRSRALSSAASRAPATTLPSRSTALKSKTGIFPYLLAVGGDAPDFLEGGEAGDGFGDPVLVERAPAARERQAMQLPAVDPLVHRLAQAVAERHDLVQPDAPDIAAAAAGVAASRAVQRAAAREPDILGLARADLVRLAAGAAQDADQPLRHD